MSADVSVKNKGSIYSLISLSVEFLLFSYRFAVLENIPVVHVVVRFRSWCLIIGGGFVVFHAWAWIQKFRPDIRRNMKYLHVNSFNTRRNRFLKRTGLPVWEKVLLFPNLLCFRYTSDHLDRNECFLRNGILPCNTLVPPSQSNCWKTGAPKLE